MYMKDKANKSSGLRSRVVTWGGNGMEIKSQNSLNSDQNQYQHTTAQKEKTKEVSKEYSLVYRGRCNHAPQKDLELGKRSITHKAIAERLSMLNAGKGIEFYIDDPDQEGEDPSDDAVAELEIAQEFYEKGIQDTVRVVANGLTYQNLSSIVVTHIPTNLPNGQINFNPLYFVANPSDQLRFSSSKMNELAQRIVPFHYYHKDWNYDPEATSDKEKANVPEIVSIDSYISDQTKNKDCAFAVSSYQNPDSRKGRFVSFPFDLGIGVFDNAYPLPSWKADSSINDIQSEFESSCIRIDYLRNGLHVFAMVNVYSTMYNNMTEDQAIEDATDRLIEDMEVIKALKGSFAAGRVLVNALNTEDPEKDGMIEIKEINLNFDSEGVRYFNEEARAAALTAWGVMADLFSVSKPEKNNLRSQGEFLKIGILLLNEKIRSYQKGMEDGYNRILRYYNLNKIKTRVIPHDSNVYLAVMADFAKDHMDINEVREKILNIAAKNEEQLDELLIQRGLLSTTQNTNQDG